MAVRRRDQLDAILQAIDKLDNDTLNTARRIIETVGTDDIEKLRDALFRYLLPVAEVGAGTAAEVGAMAYNAWREEDLGEKIKTIAVSAYDEGKYMSAINAAVKKAERGGTVDEMISTLSGRVGYTSRTSYSSSLFENGRRDPVKPKFARCPASGEACQFCLMLASRGFEYSKGKLGSNVHNHDNCRCTYTCSWDKRPEAQGYSAEKYYAEWKASIEKEAEERADRKGTTVEEERKAIMQRYSDQATRSRKASKESGAVSGALTDENDPFGERRDRHAWNYYEEVRNRDREPVVSKLAKSSEMEKGDTERAFNHLFIQKHELSSGVSRFYPDYEIAQSIQRLLEGENIQEHDLLLLRHELLESQIMEKGYSQQDAHEMANLKYNYAEAVLKSKEGGAA